MIDFRPILAAILDEYALLRDGIHGVSHWARVMENGLRLAKATGASVEIVRLFAVFHDAMRITDGHDPEHGRRGADFARSLRGELFDLVDDDFNRLYKACAGHTHEPTHPDVTIPDLLGRRPARPGAGRHHASSQPSLHRRSQEAGNDQLGARPGVVLRAARLCPGRVGS
jgi:hypothetical protein